MDIPTINEALADLTESEHLLKSLGSLPTDVVREFFVERKKQEKILNEWTWAGYIFYALGWGIALAGSLIGENEAPGTE